MSRFGCVGCFFILGVVALIIVVLLGTLALSTNIFEVPPLPSQDFTQEDGRRFQQKLAEIILRDAKVSARKDPVVITQKELNAFLSRHLLESERIRFFPLVVQFTKGTVEVRGQTELKSLLAGFPFNLFDRYLPDSITHRPIWLAVRGQIKIVRGRGEFVIDDFTLGRQTLSPWLFSWFFGRAASRLTEWRVPASVDQVVIEEGRAIITLRQ